MLARGLVLMARPLPLEFRLCAIESVRISDRPLSQVAREFDISNSALSRWVGEDDFAKAESQKASAVEPVLDAGQQAERCDRAGRCTGWRRRTRS